jgi:hypothetical protein
LFNGAKRPLTDHDLARLCLAAEPRCKIDDPAVGGIFATMLEADLADRCVARSDPNSESESVTLPDPFPRQFLDLFPHIKREPNGTLSMIGTRDRIVEDDQDAVREETF